MRAMLAVFVAMVVFSAVAPAAAGTPSDQLIVALIIKESRGRGGDYAVGDTGLKDKAYGCLQIRQPFVTDYNRCNGTTYRAEDCLGNRSLSITILRWCLGHYATRRRLGREPTDQDRARIWNGGPDGYKNPATLGYWLEVKEILKAIANNKAASSPWRKRPFH